MQRAAFGPEDRGVGERCILGFNSGPPMLPSAYNNNVQIFQTGDHVALLNEMVHNTRIIPLDGRPHLPGGVRQWVGDSRGRWQGDTLVVETTNFHGETAFPNSGPDLRLTERFSRPDASTLLYEFTVDDPSTWTKPWTVQVPMKQSSRADVRIRLPRRQLRHDESAPRGSSGGKDKVIRWKSTKCLTRCLGA